ncbi:AMP-binding protein [Streptomyces sp. NPDC047014]|uniref:AMP-binding protein n=1 Tax=Streptomyces sp. NPDC047014 TaxID=3155736 RepID=UPI0034113FAF
MGPLLGGCTPWPQEFVDRYWAAGHWRGNTLDNLLREWAQRYGPRTALVHGATRVTYAHLNRRVDRMAAGFRLRGLSPGLRVVVQLPNVPEFVVTLFALMRAGVVPVLCPVSRSVADLPEIVRLTQAVGYVGPAAHHGVDHTAVAADIAARWPFLRRVFTLPAPGDSSPYGGLTTDSAGCQYAELGTVDAAPGPSLAQSADQVAFLLLAEAPGAPRLVPRTHNDYAYQARAAAEAVSLTQDDVYLTALPAGSNLALGGPGIIGTLAVGGTVVLAEDVGTPDWLAAVEREGVTVASPGSDAGCAGFEPGAASLRLVQVPGHAVPAPAPDHRLQQVFGGPEGPLLLAPPGAPAQPLSPDDEFRVVDEEGKDVPDGSPGRLLARGPCTPRGYYRAPEAEAAFTPSGWFRTGLRARRMPGGGLLVCGSVGEGGGGEERWAT